MLHSPLLEAPLQTLSRLLRRLGAVAEPEAPEAEERSALPQKQVEALVGASVRDASLYLRALTHRSVLRGHTDTHLLSNERLEYLGDAVLGFITAEHLHHLFPDQDEGFLTRLRAKLVNGQALAAAARRIQLGALLFVSDNVEETGGRQNASILSDALEAFIGAIYLDLGMAQAKSFVYRVLFQDVDLASLAEQHDNYKSLLLEYAQARGWPQPHYRLAGEEGPSHERQFIVEVVVRREPYGRGAASSKKRAEQRAAAEALARLRAEEANLSDGAA